MTSSHTKAELFAEAQRRRVLLAPVATAAELVADEHLHARGYWDDGRRPDVPRPVRQGVGVAAAGAAGAARRSARNGAGAA